MYLKKKKIIFLNTFDFGLVDTGGRQRLYHTCLKVSKNYKVKLIVVSEKPFSTTLMKNIEVLNIEITHEQKREISYLQSKDKISISDIAIALTANLNQDAVSRIAEEIENSDGVVLAHPYLVNYLPDHLEIPCFYDAHNCEYELKRLAGVAPETLRAVFDIESNAIKRSKAIFTTSNDDINMFRQKYGDAAYFLAENGFEYQHDSYLEPRNRVSVGGGTKFLFMGSAHEPNKEAVREILSVASKTKRDIRFYVLGSVCNYFPYIKNGGNVVFYGEVSNAVKSKIIKKSTAGVNPVLTGSGTNLKTVEYAMAGLPIISSEFGIRGTFKETDAIIYHDSLANGIDDYFRKTDEIIIKMAERTHAKIKLNSNWDKVLEQFQMVLDSYL